MLLYCILCLGLGWGKCYDRILKGCAGSENLVQRSLFSDDRDNIPGVAQART